MSFHVVTASALRLREAPRPDAKVLASVPRGSSVELVDKDATGVWSQVKRGKQRGWMSSKYLSPLGLPGAPNRAHEEFAWLPIAFGELGVREVLGDGDATRVRVYLASVELDRTLAQNDETPWCSAFAAWCVETAGYASTNSARAKSWLDWGRPLIKPRRGCIAVFDRPPHGGHVGFFLSATGSSVTILGGNQSDRVCVADYPMSRLLDYRAPHA